MSKDYSHMQAQMAGDLRAAAAVSSTAKEKDFRISTSHLPKIIPSGAKVNVKSLPIGKLKMGDIICVSMDKQVVLRRFLKLKLAKNDTYLLTAYEGFDRKEALPKSCLLGRVVTFEAGGQVLDPYKLEGLFGKFWNRLTEYGTHAPFGIGAAKN